VQSSSFGGEQSIHVPTKPLAVIAKGCTLDLNAELHLNNMSLDNIGLEA
jgi:hypothetical protein